MISFIFTIDYEIYGDGTGSLQELVVEPAEKLRALFAEKHAKFVTFVEVAEFERMEALDPDPIIQQVKQQIRRLHHEGFEIGLHIHPQWFNAVKRADGWALDYREYNLCALPADRIAQLVTRSLDYLRRILQAPDFVPLAYRAGNWLFQPSRELARALAALGLAVDSSVYKGGRQRHLRLDYRRALKNGYFWPFVEDINIPDRNGALIELPVHTRMVPVWRMITAKRIGLQHKTAVKPGEKGPRTFRVRDFIRFRHPMKLDFCRMSAREFKEVLDEEIEKDRRDPTEFRPLVAIGHTKDMMDVATVDDILSYVLSKGIEIADMRQVFNRIARIAWAERRAGRD